MSAAGCTLSSTICCCRREPTRLWRSDSQNFERCVLRFFSDGNSSPQSSHWNDMSLVLVGR